jgi:tetratricopeptide (TPR) repeat protein
VSATVPEAGIAGAPSGQLPPLLRSRTEQSGLLVAAVLLGGVGFAPQFGGPGYESALAGGLILPSVAAITTALCLARYRAASSILNPYDAFDALGRGAVLGGVLAFLGALIATLHGLRAGFCDAPLGYELWATGPAPGAVLGGVWGASAGLLAARFERPRPWSVFLALAGPLGSFLLGLGRFYTSPMVFGFDPFVGYFAGPLYDTIVDPGMRLLSYRAGSLSSLLCVAVLAFHVRSVEVGRFRLVWRGRPGLVAAGALAFGISVAITIGGAELGHWSTAASIREALGRELEQGRCRVVYSAGVSKPDAERVARECVGHLPEVESYLGARGPERVTVYLFASDGEKGALMGASRTYIAKPWRAEVYVQAAGFPHPTLGHELAHVVSASFAPGPFRVAGPLGGIIPDPGRIEGIAVAASPGEDDDFTLLEWSKALLDLKLLPEMASVFRLGFLAKASNTAYTVAGAFVSWFHDRYGARALREWYGGQSIEQASGGKSMAALDAEFRKTLAEIELRPELLAMAKARFDRPSIFGRLCPRRVDRDLGLAEARLGAGDVRGAREAYRSLLELEHDNTRARLGLAQCDLRDGDLESAIRRYQALASDRRLTVLERASALEARGDIETIAARPERAIAAYAEVRKLDADEDRQRTLEVKIFAAPDTRSSGVRLLLIGDAKRGPSWDEAAPTLGAEAARGDPLAQYLLGRNLWLHGRPEAALRYLDQALDPNPPEPRSGFTWPPAASIVREAARLRLVVSCSDPKFARAQAHDDARRIRADPHVPAAKKEAVSRFARRCGLD